MTTTHANARQKSLNSLIRQLSKPVQVGPVSPHGPSRSDILARIQLFAQTAGTLAFTTFEAALEQNLRAAGRHLSAFDHPERGYGWTVSSTPGADEQMQVQIGSLPKKMILNDKDDPSLGMNELYITAVNTVLTADPEVVAHAWLATNFIQGVIRMHASMPGVWLDAFGLKLEGDERLEYISGELGRRFGSAVAVRALGPEGTVTDNPQEGYVTAPKSIQE